MKMTQNNHCSLCITISEDYKLQVKVIDEQDKDHFIKLNDQQQEEYLPTIEEDGKLRVNKKPKMQKVLFSG